MLLGLHIGSEKIAEDFLVKEKVKFWTVILTLPLASESFLKEMLKKVAQSKIFRPIFYALRLFAECPDTHASNSRGLYFNSYRVRIDCRRFPFEGRGKVLDSDSRSRVKQRFKNKSFQSRLHTKAHDIEMQ